VSLKLRRRKKRSVKLRLKNSPFENAAQKGHLVTKRILRLGVLSSKRRCQKRLPKKSYSQKVGRSKRAKKGRQKW
jgi:hypothetical protein